MGFSRVHPWLRLAFWALPLAWLWFRLIGQLQIGWSLNPQYAYGWAVPFLCLYLIWKRAESRKQKTETDKAGPAVEGRRAELSSSGFSFSAFQLLSICFLAFLYAPVWLIQAANPGWSLGTWPLAGITVGLTLLFLRALTQHDPRNPPQSSIPNPQSPHFSFSAFAFPICFFFVAVPWPFVIEQPVIQGLTRLNTALTVEILGLLGVPAIPRGNVIEVATGSVGIDEACSGIRSLQATLMISLFLGDLRRLSVSGRLGCVLGGFALAMACNLVRTLLLCWVAAWHGIPAIAGWHDPAGVTILLVCFCGIWALSWALQKAERGKQKAESREQKAETASLPEAAPMAATLDVPPSSGRVSVPARPVQTGLSSLAGQRFSMVLSGWLLLVEAGVAGWYHHLEVNLPAQPTWHLAWPATNAFCRDVPIEPKAREMLRYDEARQVQWVEAEGTRWQLSWYYWKPGQAAAYLAKTHSPLICMPAAGFPVTSVSPVEFASIGALRMPVRLYQFAAGPNSVHVLYSRWEDQAVEQPFGSEGATRLNRLRSIRTGRGNGGQRVISLTLWTAEDAPGAREQLLGQLRNLLVVDP